MKNNQFATPELESSTALLCSNGKPFTLYVVDDHKVVINGVVSSLQYNTQAKIIGSATSVAELFDFCEHQQVPSIILMDIQIGNESGITATKTLVQQYPWVHIIAMTGYTHIETIKEFFACGGKGFITKDADISEIITAVNKARNGEDYVGSVANNFILKNLVQPTKTEATTHDNPNADLTKREREIVRLIASGETSPSIAERLFLSPRTVETHRKNIMHKLGIHNVNSLVRWAFKHLPGLESDNS